MSSQTANPIDTKPLKIKLDPTYLTKLNKGTQKMPEIISRHPSKVRVKISYSIHIHHFVFTSASDMINADFPSHFSIIWYLK